METIALEEFNWKCRMQLTWGNVAKHEPIKELRHRIVLVYRDICFSSRILFPSTVLRNFLYNLNGIDPDNLNWTF